MGDIITLDNRTQMKGGRYKLEPKFRGLFIIIGITNSTLYFRPIEERFIDQAADHFKQYQQIIQQGQTLPVYSADKSRAKPYKSLLLYPFEYLQYSKAFNLPKPLYYRFHKDEGYIGETLDVFSEHDRSEIEMADKIMNISLSKSFTIKPCLLSERSRKIRELAFLARKFYDKESGKKVTFSDKCNVYTIKHYDEVYYCLPNE